MRTRTLSSVVSLALASLIVVAPAAAAADTLTLMWDANPEPEVAGYIVHVGTQPGTYTQHIDVGPSTSYDFSSAVAGQQYCFAVTAYFAGPIESGHSEEVCGYSNRPPTLTNPGGRSSVLQQPASLQLQGSDPDGQSVSYTATGLPAGLSVQGSTGFISGTPTTAGSYTVTATVSDGVLTTSQSFTWTITTVDTTAPIVTIASPTSSATYTSTTAAITLAGTASDAAGITQVTWVNDRGGSGTAAGTTNWTAANIALQTGSNTITVSARDAAGNSASDVITVTYNAALPTLAPIANQTTAVGQTVSLQLTGSSANGGTLSYSAAGLPPGLSLAASTERITGAPTTAGTYQVTATVSEGSLTASRSFTWTVTGNDTTAPVITVTSPTTASTFTTMAATISLAGTATDNVGVTDVGWISNRGGSGLATGTSNWSIAAIPLQAGTNAITVGARDAAGNITTTVLTVTVVQTTNSAPTLADPGAQTGSLGKMTSLQLAATDPDGDVLTYSAIGLPPGLAIAASTGLISGTPTAAGTYTVTATASDGALTASRSFTWTVAGGDSTPPVVTITGPTAANTYVSGSASVTLSGGATDNTGVTQVTWVNSRGGSGTASGTSVWTIAGIALQAGDNVITVSARDAAGNVASDVLTVTCNSAPELTAVPAQSTEVGRPVSLALVAGDNDGDLLTFGAHGLPPGLAIAVATGVISGTPDLTGTYPVTVTVFDGVQSASRSFTWTVTPDVTAPVVAVSQPAAAASSVTTSTVAIAGSASDLVGVIQVTWSSDRGASGVAAGTTAWQANVALQEGVNVITITARDAAGNTATAVRTVTLAVAAPPPTAPTLEPVPNQTTRVGRTVSLQLVASDVNGDTLIFGALDLPRGLTISPTTGLISGRPTTTGTYRVTVGVTDGERYTVRTLKWTITR